MKILSSLLSSLQGNTAASAGVVGVDIGSSSIKVVELQDRKGVLTLSTYGEVQLGPYANDKIGRSVTLEPEQEQAALVDVIRESAVKARSAVFAMPLSSSFVTNVSLEAGADDDLSSMVRIEARKVIPASLSEVTLDWAEVEATQGEGNRRNVLVAAIQNAALERFKVLMQFAGLSEPPTEIECFSSLRGLYNTEIENIAIVDIGAVSSKLYIARKGLLMRMHRIRAGGAIATEHIAKALEVDFETAEELKYQADSSHQSFTNMKRAHNSSYERAFREFNQVLREYEQRTGHTLDEIFITGGGSLFPGTNKLLADSLSRSVVVAHPFSKAAYPAFMDDTLKAIGPSFTVAMGAALRMFE